jgi:hypothetical protein
MQHDSSTYCNIIGKVFSSAVCSPGSGQQTANENINWNIATGAAVTAVTLIGCLPRLKVAAMQRNKRAPTALLR